MRRHRRFGPAGGPARQPLPLATCYGLRGL